MDTSLTNGSNCSQHNFTNKTCFKFCKDEFETVAWIRVGMSILAAMMCCLAIVMIVFFKAYKRFVHRLALYLSIAALFSAPTFAIELVPVQEKYGHAVIRNEYKPFCTAIGFLTEYVLWVILILTCWIALHLFILGVFKRNYTSLKYEAGGIITSLAVPVVFSIIPLIHFKNGRLYGLSGAWCWIKIFDKDCDLYVDGIIEQFVLWYGPVMFFVGLNFLAMLAVIIVLYRGTKGDPDQIHIYKTAVKEALPLLFYPVLFSAVYSLAFANRVYYAVTQKTNYPLWISHAIADPFLPLFIPVAFLLHPYTLKRLKCHELRRALNKWGHHSENSHTRFIVSRENSDDSEYRPLIIESSRGVQSDSQSFRFIHK